MEKLETELAALRARAETLSSRHAAAERAFADAKARLQQYLIEADLDADEKVRMKLETAVATCTVTRDGYTDALGEVQAKLVDVERKVADERTAVQRKAASEQLARDLDAFEKALPGFLEGVRDFTAALEPIEHWHYETGEMSRFVSNCTSQVEVPSAFALQDLHGMVNAIADGSAPIPVPKREPPPIVIEQPAPTRRVFCLKSIKWRDDNGRQHSVMQYEDADLPPPLADKALRRGFCAPVTDDHRKTLKNARGGQHPNVDAIDIVDLDDLDDPKAPYIGPETSDVLRHADFQIVDRGPARTGTINVARVL